MHCKHNKSLLTTLTPTLASQNKMGWTALMCACRNEHLEVARLLLAKGDLPPFALYHTQRIYTH